MKTFNYHHDSGHGWLAVKLEYIVDLGIVDQISQYSYIRGNSVYLEEDCDAPLFHKEYTKKYGKYDVTNKYYDRRSPIRGYTQYSAERIHNIIGQRSKQNPFEVEENNV